MWINTSALHFADFFAMAQPRPPIRPCPVCGIAMQAHKSREDRADYDLFRCLSCETTIVRAPAAGKDGE
jgi:hypothetical protein